MTLEQLREALSAKRAVKAASQARWRARKRAR